MENKSFLDRLRSGWSAFTDKEVTDPYSYDYGISYSTRPDRLRLTIGNEQSIISSIYNRISLDVAAIKIQHIRADENERYLEQINSGLNSCLNLEANIDQTGRAFIQDVVMSMFDEGSVAIIPVDTTINPNVSGSYDIITMRVAEILEWYPRHIRVNVYNDRTGQKEHLIISKKIAAIIENPLYSVMNEPNSTLKRLINKLNLLDAVDKQSGSGKLDLIIQLPYVIKTPARKSQAEQRRKDIEEQLADSKYGIAYTDATEKITQLNRPTENNLMSQIEYLTSMLYSQLGLTEKIFEGTADEATMLNYYSRTVEPIVSSIVDGLRRSFLTKTARSQGQTIHYLRSPFALVPAIDLADIADKFTRNEILSSNEFRAIMGYKPDKDPKSDELRNKNINSPKEEETPKEKVADIIDKEKGE